jgi:bla regulator protein blaR1
MTTIITSLWQGLSIAAATAILLGCTPRVNAATRYAVWWMALLAVIALPVLHVFSAPHAVVTIPSGLTLSESPRALVLPSPPDWAIACVAGVWLGTVLLGFWRIVGGLARMSTIRRRSRPVDAAIARRLTLWTRVDCNRRAELRSSREIAGACALGLCGRPVIVLSDRLIATLEADVVDRIVLHEQAHLSRYDDWTTLGQAVIRTVLGLHPAVRLIDAHIDFEREASCDDAVVSTSGGSTHYARCLAQAADVVAAESRMLAALTPNATGAGSLIVRVQRLLDPRVPRHARVQLTTVAAGFLAFAAAGAAGVNARLIVIADATARLPVIQGSPAHLSVGSQSLAATARQLPEPDREISRPLVVSRVVNAPQKPPAVPETSDAEPPWVMPEDPQLVPVAVAEKSNADTPAAPPLQSRALTVSLQATTTSSPDEQGAGWSSAGRAGAALGRSVARMGASTGTRSQQAGSAIGGLFSRAGKAVADSF